MEGRPPRYIAQDTPRSGPSQWFLRDNEPPEGWTYENCGVELRSEMGRTGSPLTVRIGRDAWDEIRSTTEHFQGDLEVECFGGHVVHPSRATLPSQCLFASTMPVPLVATKQIFWLAGSIARC